MSMNKYEVAAVKEDMSADEIFFEIESECGEDLSNIMIGGRRIESHSGTQWRYDDGR